MGDILVTYTEGPLIEQPSIKLFNDLDWDTLNSREATFGKKSLLGRENHGYTGTSTDLKK